MDMVALRSALDTCLDTKQPVMQVTAVLGSTEESAVDPLADILAIRDEYRAMGLEFSVHADGAWGGYFASLLRAPLGKPGEEETNVTRTETDAWRDLMLGDGERAPGIMLSPYVMRQMLALPGADSITVDPHKAGFAPYPAGALCYRNGAMRDMVSFKAPVVFHGGIDPTVGVYGIEGSKPGAAAAAVYLAHRVIRTDRSGYGDLLARCQFNAKRFYAMLVISADRISPSRRSSDCPPKPCRAPPAPMSPRRRDGSSRTSCHSRIRNSSPRSSRIPSCSRCSGTWGPT
jgi:glutamate/tyrosine decarboxylase-like PLP-dependent enzyme